MFPSNHTHWKARSADLVEYFTRKGYALKREGAVYRVQGLQGLTITPSKSMWYIGYTGEGGKSSIDCLMNVLNIDFKAAVVELTDCLMDEQPTSNVLTSATTSIIIMPERAENEKRVIAYLCQKRLIPYELVLEFIKRGKLYQAKDTGNAVFPHFKHGETVGAELHGCGNTRFKGITPGTHQSVFSYHNTVVKRALIFESAIDLLSFITLHDKQVLNDTALLSLGGLKNAILSDLRARDITILSCVDNCADARFWEQANKIERFCNTLEQENVKDWNELLQKKRL